MKSKMFIYSILTCLLFNVSSINVKANNLLNENYYIEENEENYYIEENEENYNTDTNILFEETNKTLNTNKEDTIFFKFKVDSYGNTMSDIELLEFNLYIDDVLVPVSPFYINDWSNDLFFVSIYGDEEDNPMLAITLNNTSYKDKYNFRLEFNDYNGIVSNSVDLNLIGYKVNK